MKSTSDEDLTPFIVVIRDRKVMLSHQLARLYDVEPKVLLQAVKRNIERFPEDFMFQLNSIESASLRSQFVTLEEPGLLAYHQDQAE